MKKLIIILFTILGLQINAQSNTSKVSENKFKIIKGRIIDCKGNGISNVLIKKFSGNKKIFSDKSGNFTMEVIKDDMLVFSKEGYQMKVIVLKNQKTISVNLELMVYQEENKVFTIVKKPVIYLYPKEETEVTLRFNFNGQLLTTFPKYEENWKVIASPNGQLFDTKTKRIYSSLFWDGEINLPKEHYQYQDGFVVKKENLTDFFIEKLEHIGLNTSETNEFIQFWLPILEQNKFNFIHFLVNDACNEISINSVNPKPETTIRVYMEFYGSDQFHNTKEQKLPKTNRKGFTLVEWGGTDVTNKIQKDEL